MKRDRRQGRIWDATLRGAFLPLNPFKLYDCAGSVEERATRPIECPADDLILAVREVHDILRMTRSSRLDVKLDVMDDATNLRFTGLR